MKKFKLQLINMFSKLKQSQSYSETNYFSNSLEYWIKRNDGSRASGVGSYGKNAKNKAKFINHIIRRLKIYSVIDFGCGDGNQLKKYKIENYVGIDVNPKQIQKLKKRFPAKKFHLLGEKFLTHSDLKMSIDVIYHLVEDYYFHDHMNNLFDGDSEYVLIFSTNFDSIGENHVRHRDFKAIQAKQYPNYLEVDISYLQKNVDFGSASFYLYRRFDGQI